MTHHLNDLFLAASDASLVMTYREDAHHIGDTHPELQSIRLGTPSGDAYHFDKHLCLVDDARANVQPTPPLHATELLYQTLKDIADRNDRETIPHRKLTHVAERLVGAAFNTLEDPIFVPKLD